MYSLDIFSKKEKKYFSEKDLETLKSDIKTSSKVNIDLRRHLLNIMVAVEYLDWKEYNTSELHNFLYKIKNDIKG